VAAAALTVPAARWIELPARGADRLAIHHAAACEALRLAAGVAVEVDAGNRVHRPRGTAERERERGSSSAQSHYSTISAEHRTCRWRILEMPACINRRHIQRVGRVAIRHHPPWRRGASVNPGAFDWQGCAVLPLQRRGAAVKLERCLHHALLRERLLRGAQPVLVTTAMIVADAPGDLSQDRSI
jgi:hypothetical protein